MSSDDLDADLSRWPENPYELLGVRPGVLPRDLRRAYARLIRTYKPEQFPEHFRRIRDAYETVLRHVQWFGGDDLSPSAEETPPVQPEPAGDSFRDPDHGLEEALHELWRRACRGDEAAAYQEMLALHHQHPGHPDLCVRLYWLLTLLPELDALRSPCDWLVTGLRASGLTGPLRELYRREVSAEPAEALSDRYTALLACPVRAGLIADFAEWRWQAAGGLEKWAIITGDVEVLRTRITGDDAEVWVRLLLSAVDQLAWVRGHSLVIQRYVQEVEQLTHLGTPLTAELDRLDYLLELVAGWRSLKIHYYDRTVTLLKLIPRFWTRPFLEVRPLLLSFLERAALEPQDMLKGLDGVQRQSAAVMAQVGKMLDAFRDSLDSPPQEPPLSPALSCLVFDFLYLQYREEYQVFRPKLLAFCLKEAVSPERMAQILEDQTEYPLAAGEHLSERLRTDWSLRYLCLAHRLFWA